MANPDDTTPRPADEWMSQRWEALAREDAEFYIWTGGTEFSASGEHDADRIWSQVEPYVAQRRAVLEIGCGVGRVLLPMARRFERAVGIDVAPTMLAKLRANAAASGLPDVQGMLASEGWEAEGPIDLVYSHIVLQHIERWEIIADYFVRVRRCLSPGGVFYAHFDTRPASLAYRVRNRIPEVLLPRTMKRGVRRIRRDATRVRALAASTGFHVVSESGAGTTESVFLLRDS